MIVTNSKSHAFGGGGNGRSSGSSANGGADMALAAAIGVASSDLPELLKALSTSAFSSIDGMWTTAMPAPSSIVARVAQVMLESTSDDSNLTKVVPSVLALLRKGKDASSYIMSQIGMVDVTTMKKINAMVVCAPDSVIEGVSAEWFVKESETRAGATMHPLLKTLI